MKIGLSLLGVYFFIIGLTGLPLWFNPDQTEVGTRITSIMIANHLIFLASGLILFFLSKNFKLSTNNTFSNELINASIAVKLLGIFFIVDTSSDVANGLISSITSTFSTALFLSLFIPPFLKFIAGFTLLFFSPIIVNKFFK